MVNSYFIYCKKQNKEKIIIVKYRNKCADFSTQVIASDINIRQIVCQIVCMVSVFDRCSINTINSLREIVRFFLSEFRQAPF